MKEQDQASKQIAELQAENELLKAQWAEWSDSLNSVMKQRNTLRAQLEAMQRQEPVYHVIVRGSNRLVKDSDLPALKKYWGEIGEEVEVIETLEAMPIGALKRSKGLIREREEHPWCFRELKDAVGLFQEIRIHGADFTPYTVKWVFDTSPKALEPLTRLQINQMMANAGWQNSGIRHADLDNVEKVVRAVESAHGIGSQQ